MILELYITLAAISVVLLWLGYATGDPHYLYVGLFFFFLLGVYLFTNQVQYETGLNETMSYSYTNNTLMNTTKYTNYNYTAFSGTYARWFGLFLSTAAGAGMAVTFLTWKKKKEDE